MDVVMNHAGYNTLCDMAEYGFGTLNSGWENYYYSMTNVNKEGYNSYINYKSSADDWAKWWGTDWVRASLPGYTEAGSDDYTKSYCGLPDFKTESTNAVKIPEILKTKWMKEGTYNYKINNYGSYQTVTNHISKWLSGWVREYGIDGFRCDTAEYVDLASWNTLKTMCTEALREWNQANPDKALDNLDFWMTGECQNHGVNYDDYYIQGGFDSMINSDTAGGEVLSLDTVAGKYNDYATAVNTNENFNVLSSMSSDNTTLARGDQKYLGSALLLLPGGVQIFYGDETNRPFVSGVNFDGNGGNGHSLRSDMNWDTVDEDILSHWQKVGTFRNNHIAVGAGSNTSVDANSGVGFVRTYSKGAVTDRVAACIGASAFTEVTMDVSSAWNTGDKVVNYYDGSSATVASDGTVTFSSGANGTILIGDPDGKPVISINGEAKFKGKQQVTISIEGADSASVSIDGGDEFTAHDGDTFTIGEKASEGATVTVSCEATNEKGTTSCKATFYKALESEDIEAPVISGVKDGETYCSAQTVTVKDNDSIKSVTVNGSAVDLVNNQFTLSPAVGTQEIIATDNAGNRTKVTVTVNDGHTDENKDHFCEVCETKFSEHSGGTATCTESAICDTCKQPYGEPDTSNHSLDKIPATDATVTETGNEEYWQCTDCKKYFSDEEGNTEITDIESWKAGAGRIDKLPPEIIEGTGQSITAGEKKALTFRSNASFDDFKRVELDGKTLDGDNYTVKEGSIIVTLDADYVATLPAGEHTIGIVSESGTAETTFTVEEKAAPGTSDDSNNNDDTKIDVTDDSNNDNDSKADAEDSAKTGDNTDLALWLALMLLSGAGITGVTAYSRRKRTNE